MLFGSPPQLQMLSRGQHAHTDLCVVSVLVQIKQELIAQRLCPVRVVLESQFCSVLSPTGTDEVKMIC